MAIENKMNLQEMYLYAIDFQHVGLVSGDVVKTRTDGFMEVKSKYMQYLTLAISDTMVICADKYSYKDVIKFEKSKIKNILGIYTQNRLLSIKDSQVQIQLVDGTYFLINRYFTNEELFTEFIDNLRGLLFA